MEIADFVFERECSVAVLDIFERCVVLLSHGISKNSKIIVIQIIHAINWEDLAVLIMARNRKF